MFRIYLETVFVKPFYLPYSPQTTSITDILKINLCNVFTNWLAHYTHNNLIILICSGSYLEFECNFCFLQMPYFGHQLTIWVWSAQPTLVSKLPLYVGSRRSQSNVEHLKYPKDLTFDSNNHSVWDVFPLEFLSNIYAM